MESIEFNTLTSAAAKDMLKLLGSRGAIEILCAFCCSHDSLRFMELRNLLSHVSTKTLSSRLKELEQEGILNRTAYNEIPPRVEYSMTEKGQALAEALAPLIEWMATRAHALGAGQRLSLVAL